MTKPTTDRSGTPDQVNTTANQDTNAEVEGHMQTLFTAEQATLKTQDRLQHAAQQQRRRQADDPPVGSWLDRLRRRITR